MNSREFDHALSLEKANSFVGVIDTVLTGNFPSPDSARALIAIKTKIEELIRDLDDAAESAEQDTFRQFSKAINLAIFTYLPFVGLLLRSGNIRNSFESYLPLRSLASSLIGSEVKLVICSEWDYSPFIHPLPRDILAEFTLIGFPASEADNPLILPLAGHELGHAIWRRTQLGASQSAPIADAVVAELKKNWVEFQTNYKTKLPETAILSDLEVRRIWLDAFDMAVRQIEELFCDTVGIFLFGKSYLQAFRYLLAPAVTDVRKNYSYPPMADRVAFNATTFHKIYQESGKWFKDCFYGSTPDDRRKLPFLVRIADTVTQNYEVRIVDLVIQHMKDRGIAPFNSDMTKPVFDHFAEACPVQNDASIATILGAAWELRENIHLMRVSIDNASKLKILANLVLKSFEVWELKHRTAQTK